MSDQNQEAGNTEAYEDAENNGGDDEYEVEWLVTREEGAAALRRLADGVANGTVKLGGDEVTIAVPERVGLEIEYEQEEGEAELEAELQWPIVDGEAVSAEREAHAHEMAKDKESTEEGQPAGDADTTKSIDKAVGVEGATSNAQFELYRDRADEWRWRLVHANGNIIADSGEGYDRKATARNGLESVMRNAPGAAIVEDD